MAFKNGKLFMPFGTPGGDMQVQGMAQMFLNMVEFGLDPQQAVEEPRAASWSHPDSFWPHTYTPGRIELEGRISKEAAAELERRGHKVDWLSDWGYRAAGLCGVLVNQEFGTLDWRRRPAGRFLRRGQVGGRSLTCKDQGEEREVTCGPAVRS